MTKSYTLTDDELNFFILTLLTNIESTSNVSLGKIFEAKRIALSDTAEEFNWQSK